MGFMSLIIAVITMFVFGVWNNMMSDSIITPDAEFIGFCILAGAFVIAAW